VIRYLFILCCALAALWQGGLGTGFLPIGPDLLPHFGLALIGIWYVSLPVYAGGILASALAIDAMQGLDTLPHLHLSLLVVCIMLSVYFRTSVLPPLSDVRRQALGGIALLLAIRAANVSTSGFREIVVYVVLSAVTWLLWRAILHSSYIAWVDTHTRSTIHT
jgi:hypothetical protein